MTIRRSAAAVGAVALGLLALSACSKPTPQATVTVGDSSATAQAERGATCWNGGHVLTQKMVSDCLASTSAPATTLKVNGGDKVHVGVEPDIADSGWTVLATQGGGAQPQGLTGALTGQTYSTLNIPAARQLFENQQTGALADHTDLVFFKTSNKGTAVTQVWKFRLQLSS